MSVFDGIRGLLVDMDGVWFVGDRVVDGAPAALARIRERGLPVRIVTNTTTRTRAQLVERLARLGLDFAPDEVVDAPTAAVAWLRRHGVRRCHAVVREPVRPMFEPFGGEGRPECVVVGDIGDAWDHALLDRLFGELVDGASLVALHRGRYQETGRGLSLDIGAYVAALEYAAGVEAVVVGKPSPEMFRAALDTMGLPADAVVMIGDDVHADVAGAQAAGIRGVLVRTGKYRDRLVAASGVRPDAVIDSIADLARRL